MLADLAEKFVTLNEGELLCTFRFLCELTAPLVAGKPQRWRCTWGNTPTTWLCLSLRICSVLHLRVIPLGIDCFYSIESRCRWNADVPWCVKRRIFFLFFSRECLSSGWANRVTWMWHNTTWQRYHFSDPIKSDANNKIYIFVCKFLYS